MRQVGKFVHQADSKARQKMKVANIDVNLAEGETATNDTLLPHLTETHDGASNFTVHHEPGTFTVRWDVGEVQYTLVYSAKKQSQERSGPIGMR